MTVLETVAEDFVETSCRPTAPQPRIMATATHNWHMHRNAYAYWPNIFMKHF